MLRTDPFALTAGDTVGSPALSCAYQAVIEGPGSEILVIEGHGIDRAEYVRYADLFRTAVAAVSAGGTADLRNI